MWEKTCPAATKNAMRYDYDKNTGADPLCPSGSPMLHVYLKFSATTTIQIPIRTDVSQKFTIWWGSGKMSGTNLVWGKGDGSQVSKYNTGNTLTHEYGSGEFDLVIRMGRGVENNGTGTFGGWHSIF